MLVRVALALVATVLVAGACGDDRGSPSGAARAHAASASSSTTTTEPQTTTRPPSDPFARPTWLGQRPLPLRGDGLGEVQPTPTELVDRQLRTASTLPPPPDDEFHSSVTKVPPDVVARSTWQEACPVGLDELRYATVSFWGFDGEHHTGELIAHREVADVLVDVFARLHEARFPIEEMRVTSTNELDAHPTGDGNNSGAFVCRPQVGASSWSEHAYGRAIDINPFHNPYQKGDVVVPELASAYTDRGNGRPGMIAPGGVVVDAFANAGWKWGGHWRSAKDWMHFSPSGR